MRTRAIPRAEERLRRSPPPTTSWGTRRGAPRTTVCARWAPAVSAPGSRATGGVRGGPGGFRYETVDVGDLSDLFGGMFGGGRARRPQARPASRCRPGNGGHGSHSTTRWPGVTIPVTLDGPAVLHHLSRDRGPPGTQPVICATCGGSGPGRGQPGLLPDGADVPDLPGTGERSRRPVPRATAVRRGPAFPDRESQGAGRGEGRRAVRVAGRGEPGGPGGQPGDLYVRVRVRRTTRFSVARATT